MHVLYVSYDNFFEHHTVPVVSGKNTNDIIEGEGSSLYFYLQYKIIRALRGGGSVLGEGETIYHTCIIIA